MGLIKAGVGSLGGTLADQWKEFFYCDALSPEVLAVKGQKRVSGRSSNTKGSDNIISNGSVIAVADGQCMMIVEQGKVVEFCAEPGQFVFDASTEPSIFTGSFGKSLLDTFKTVGRRFTFGGDTGKDQRVYYFNTKEIVDNKFGTATPIPFRVVDRNIGLDIDVSVRCNGVYSYKISDPMLFYTHVCGNVEGDYKRSEIDSMLKTEFISALQPAFARISELEVRPSALPAHARGAFDVHERDALSQVGRAARPAGRLHCHEPHQPPRGGRRSSSSRHSARPCCAIRPWRLPRSTGAQAEAMKTAAGNNERRDDGLHGHGHGPAGMAASMRRSFMPWASSRRLHRLHRLQTAGNAAAAQRRRATSARAAEQKSRSLPQTAGRAPAAQTNTGKFCSACGKPRPDRAAGPAPAAR